MRAPDPEVVAALRKRFSELQQDQDIIVFDEGRQRYQVAFHTPKWHMACRLTLTPVKLTNCRTVHQ
jgi:hypothetical protein